MKSDSLFSTHLADCRRLFLRGYTVEMTIGAYPVERKSRQRVVIDVDLFVPLSVSTPTTDALNEVVDYNLMRDTVAAIAARAPVHLLETFCDCAMQHLLGHPQVRAVRICAAKPDIYPDCAAVGVELFRIKEASHACI
jgi:7,8-dihydroneopterin aldolase/epimerase/oxygenase